MQFTLDVRHPSTSKLSALCKAIEAQARHIAEKKSEKGCVLDWKEDFDSPAVAFHSDCIRSVRDAAEATVGAQKALDIYSGAGHDT